MRVLQKGIVVNRNLVIMVRFANVNRSMTTNNISSVLCNDYMCNMKRKSTLVDSVSAEPEVSAVGRKQQFPQSNGANSAVGKKLSIVHYALSIVNCTLLIVFCLFFSATAWGQITLLSENFDNMSSISTSYSATNWYAYNAGSGNIWELSSDEANSGSYSASYSYDSDYGANCYLVSPPFSVTANMTRLNISLYEKTWCSGNWPEKFEVFFVKANDFSTAAGVVSATHYSAIASATYTNSDDFDEISGSNTNSALAGQSVRAVIHCTSDADMNALFIDDIIVAEVSSNMGDMCAITIELTDAYGDGGGSMQVINSSTSVVLGSYTLGSGSSATYTLNVFDGTPLSFVYASTDSWPYENGYVILDPNGDEVARHDGCGDSDDCDAPNNGEVATYTVNCSACPNPTNLTAANVTAHTATISWTPSGGTVQFSMDGTNWETMNTNSKSLTGLTAGTNYTVYVRTNCGGGDYSSGVGVSFTTSLCDPSEMCEITVELTDAYGDGGGSMLVINSSTSAVLGSYTLDNGSSATYTLNVCNGTPLSFVYASTDSWPYENGYLILDPNGDEVARHDGCRDSGDCNELSDGEVTTYTVNCSACPNPTNLTATNVTTQTATISWTPSGGTVQFSMDGTNWETMNTNSKSLTGLTAGTNYTVYVRTNCGGGDYSRGVSVLFTTLCDVFSLPFVETFSSSSDTRDCWTIVDVANDVYYEYGIYNGAWNYDEESAFYAYQFNENGEAENSANDWLISPPISIVSGAKLVFDYKVGSSSYPEKFEVYVLNSPYNLSGTIIMSSGELTNTSYLEIEELDLSSYAGQDIYIGIKCVSDADKLDLYIDNFKILKPITHISTVTQWEEFCSVVNNYCHTYNGETVYLAANIGPVSTMAGTSSCPFRGTFEGQGYKINVGISSSEQGAAPFRYISGATIQNLKVDGTVTSTAHHASGLVGFCADGSTNTIQNCHISTNVTNNNAYNGDSGSNYMGGIVGHNKGATTSIIGCVYDGTLTSQGFKGGMIGFADPPSPYTATVYITITDSYFAGSYSANGYGDPNFSPVAVRAGHNFIFDLTSSNFYYNTDAGDFTANQYSFESNSNKDIHGSCKHAYTVTGESPVTVAMNGTPTTYNVSGITAYSTGIVYDGTIYGGDGDVLALSLSGSSCDYETDHGTLSGSGNPYSLTMEAYNTKISAPVYTVTVNAGEGGTASGSGTYNCGENATLTATPSSGYYFYQWNDGNTDNSRTINITSNVTYTATFKQAPLTINNTTDWNNFAEAISRGYNYSSKTVTLTNDITVNTIIPGSPWAVSSGFHGTFDGQCHTITINNYTTSDEFVGLFRYTYGATIKNLIVDGTINSSNIRAGGLIGLAQATTTFTNCRSNVTINSTYSGTAQNGGFVGAAVNKITFEGCAFSGSLNGANATQNGGFVGNYYYESSYSHTYTNCLFVPLSMNIGTTNSSTFAPTTYNTFTNCYYTEALGTQQGTQVYSVTGDGVGVSLQGSASTSYSCSGLDFYSPGLTFNGTIYGSNLALSLSYEGLISGYTTSNGDLSGSSHTGVNDEYTLASLSGNAIINQTPCPFDNPPAGLIWKGGTDGDVTNWEIATNWAVYNESETRYQLAGSAPSESSNVFIIRNDACNIEGVPSLSSNKECNDITLAGIGVNIADGKYLTVNGTATFTSGIVTGDVTFGSGATVSGASTSSYVNGKVTRNGMSGAFTFPTGTATLYAPFKATSSSASNVSVQYAAGHDGMPDWWNHSGNLYDAGLNHASDRENWQLSASASTELSSIILYWNESDNHSFEEGNEALNSYLNVAAVKRNGFNWQNLGRASIEGDYDGSGSITAAEPLVIEISGAKAAGEGDYFVTFASSNNNLLLPIELTSFTATCDGRSALVEWSTASERTNDYFSLERSDDAINFVEVARVAGAGNSIEPIDYAYNDYGIHGGDNYYRLVQVDYDGTRTVSEVIVANCIEPESDGEPEVLAYPNPFSSELTVVLDNFGNRAATIEVYDMLGKLIYTNKVAAPQNSYETILNLSNLPPAAYTVRVSTNDFVINRNVVKQ